MRFKAPHSEIAGHAERYVGGDIDGHVEKKPAIPGVGSPGMKQDVERTRGKVTSLKRPRVKRTVNDEEDYGDENPGQIILMVSVSGAPAISALVSPHSFSAKTDPLL